MAPLDFIPDPSKLITDGGLFRIRNIFFEKSLPETRDSVIYTLKDRDHNGYPSLYLLYMAEDDPTEYEFACKYLGSWSFWEQLSEAGWFKEYVDRWRKELHLRASAKALKRIKKTALADTRDALAANKYLLERGWIPKEDKNGKGRPSKEAIKSEATRIALEDKELHEAAVRIGLN